MAQDYIGKHNHYLNKVNQKTKQVKTMQKSWYQSKGVWGGLLVVVGGVATAFGQYLQGNLDFATFFNQVLPLLGTGWGIIGVRSAQK